jgi:hypothetical protein
MEYLLLGYDAALRDKLIQTFRTYCRHIEVSFEMSKPEYPVTQRHIPEEGNPQNKTHFHNIKTNLWSQNCKLRH